MPDVGTKLIFENERVRIWEFTLQPGETIEAHRHEHDYFFYPAASAPLWRRSLRARA
jgi:quercetin dioxygenase-like cupin family protein